MMRTTACTLVLLMCAAPALAATPPSQGATPTTRLFGAPGQPNISGVWVPRMGPPPGSTPGGKPVSGSVHPPSWGDTPPPLTPEYQAKFARIQAAMAAGKPLASTASECKALGVPYVEFGPDPMEIIQTPGQITMIEQTGHEVRRIYTDGRKQDPDPDPWFDGHSVGHWQGKTLMVDVVGLRPETDMGADGAPHSDALHVTEQFTLTDPNTLVIHSTATDRKAFTRAWTATHTWTRAPADYEVLEDVCEDNNRNATNADGTQGVTLTK